LVRYLEELNFMKSRLMKILTALVILLMSISMGRAQKFQLYIDSSKWAAFGQFEVKKGRKSMSFGQYKTVAFKRSWTRISSAPNYVPIVIPAPFDMRRVLEVESKTENNAVFFALRDSTGLTAEVYCDSDSRSIDFSGWGAASTIAELATTAAQLMAGFETDLYYVQIYLDGEMPWQLITDQVMSQVKRDYEFKLFRTAEEYYTIKMVRQIVDRNGRISTFPISYAGIEIKDRSGISVAAVSFIYDTLIYLAANLAPKERLLLASACAALALD
jgi:hypothetical protein